MFEVSRDGKYVLCVISHERRYEVRHLCGDENSNYDDMMDIWCTRAAGQMEVGAVYLIVLKKTFKTWL